MYDVVIIGSGPAGLSASIYAKRAGLKAVTLEQNPMSGGKWIITPDFPALADLIWDLSSESMQISLPVNLRKLRSAQ